MDVIHYNSQAWDRQVDKGNEWTQPVSAETIERARQGDWKIVLTPTLPVPKSWFGDLKGKKVLCLAGGGGQQAPILAAAGANVSTLDNSQNQLNRDREVAEREGLSIDLFQGDMAKLDMFDEATFDLVFNPCSICFSPNPRQVWKEVARVLKTGGRMMTGICNPVLYMMDEDEMIAGRLKVRHKIPYSDERDLPEDQKQRFVETGEPFAFGHTLDDLLGGITAAGLAIVRMYEDGFGECDYSHFNEYIKTFMAVAAVKLPSELQWAE